MTSLGIDLPKLEHAKVLAKKVRYPFGLVPKHGNQFVRFKKFLITCHCFGHKY
jgi:hypothetical protein